MSPSSPRLRDNIPSARHTQKKNEEIQAAIPFTDTKIVVDEFTDLRTDFSL